MTVRLSLVNSVHATSSLSAASTSRSQPSQGDTTLGSSSNFKSAKERKALRKIAIAQDAKGKKPALPPAKVYERHDVRVGDAVRIRGRIDEWMRGKEWIRQVAVEPGAGGSICAYLDSMLRDYNDSKLM